MWKKCKTANFRGFSTILHLRLWIPLTENGYLYSLSKNIYNFLKFFCNWEDLSTFLSIDTAYFSKIFQLEK